MLLLTRAHAESNEVEVSQILAFLLQRDLGWLNTFAAFVIPAAANGCSILLWRGIFNSLPKELY